MPRGLLGVSVLLAALGVSSVARADGAVVGATAVTDVRIAVATSNGRTVRWASVHATGGTGAFAWLVPVRAGSTVDYASDAWLEGLDDSTAPRIVPPTSPPSCAETLGIDVVGNSGHVATTAPTATALATTLAQLQGVAMTWGFAIDDTLATRLNASFAAGEAFVALLYGGPGTDVVTRTLRIVDDGPAIIPLVLTRSEAAPIEVTAYVIGQGRASFQDAGEINLNAAAVTWNADGTSTYAAVKESALIAAPGSWLIEGTNHGALFDGAGITGVVTVPSLAASYFQRAATYGETDSNPAECVLDAQGYSIATSVLDAPCPAGAVAQVGTPPEACAPPAAPHFLCGDSVAELSEALGGTPPAYAWVTRAVTLVPAGTFGADVPLAIGTGDSNTPVIVASDYSQHCKVAGGVPTPTPPQSGGNPIVGAPGGGGGPGSGQGAVVGQGTDNSTDVPDVPTDGCDSGDSSDSSGCDSSSSGSDSSGGACDGSGDSGGGGCDGGGGGGGGCDGGGGGGGDCAVQQRRSHHGRSPLSRYLLGFTFGAALLRRLNRRKTA